jgi:Cu(I)/Ag(I) efflux system membrane fusion protein
MNNTKRSITFLTIGLIIGGSITALLDSSQEDQANNKTLTPSNEKNLLYWVAPMDPNYRQDGPGKSPMGMDLVPVYQDQTDSSSPGTVKISPEVIHNLGVRTALIERKPLVNDIKTVGYVGYDENTLIQIHPRTEGWIETLYVKFSGEKVSAGQALYSLYSPTLVNAQEELLLALERGNQRLIQASEDRLKALQVPAYAIKQLKQRKRVSQTIIFFAPKAGIVDHLNVREGFFIKPSQSIMSIGSLDEVWVDAEVFERQTPLVQPNAPVTMTLNYLPGSTWRGAVDYVYPVVNKKNRTIKVRMRFINKSGELKPNMFAEVVIHGSKQNDSLLAPKEALIRTGAMSRLVLALGDGRFKSVMVKTGRFDDNNIEILSGVEEGDKVVTSAQFLIDSESSKSSEFSRMEEPQKTIKKDIPESAEVEGTINSISTKERIINISHGAIQKWRHPVMSMDFKLDESLNMEELKVGMTVRFSFVIRDGFFLVTHITSLNAISKTNNGITSESRK